MLNTARNVLSLLTSITAVAAITVVLWVLYRPPVDEQAWRAACTITRNDCAAMQQPIVNYTSLPGRGAWGQYDYRQHIVWIDYAVMVGLERTLIQPWHFSVLVHEMTHALDWKRPEGINWPEDRCAIEGHAFEVQNQWLRRVGRPELQDLTWAERYGCAK